MLQSVIQNNFKNLLEKFSGSPFEIFGAIISLLLMICVLAIAISVGISFANAGENTQVRKEKKSIVETFTMTLFFILYYATIKFRIGEISFLPSNWVVILSLFGILIVLLGTYVNIKGRYELGKNWANQIKVYKNHSLIQSGMYKVVRHPLYASLIWIFFGGSFIFLNYVAFLLNTLVFIPFMYYRAKQEEQLLSESFPEYDEYKSKVMMFFPKILP